MGLGEKLEVFAETWCVIIPGPGQEAGGLVPAIYAHVDCPVYKTMSGKMLWPSPTMALKRMALARKHGGLKSLSLK